MTNPHISPGGRCAELNSSRAQANGAEVFGRLWPRGLLAVLSLALLLCGCERARRDMYDQPRDKPLAASPFFPDHRSSRPLVQGTIAHSGGVFAGASSGRQQPLPVPPARPVVAPIISAGGAGSSGPWMPSLEGVPGNVSLELLQRGRQRYDIYCSPCHGLTGDGDGMVVRRGFIHPPTYHSDRLRNAPDSHFYDVITSGYGAMFPYADRVTREDRWAIVAYIRALQLSEHAPVSALQPAERARLEGTAQ
jgi:mono/diheme cytochrome c family protein